MVIVAGEIAYQDGKFTRVDRESAVSQLSETLKRPLSSEEREPGSSLKPCFHLSKRFTTGIMIPPPTCPITGKTRGFEG
jgi:5-methylthioadenosine/S-adenosylhomocysteine deaminase